MTESETNPKSCNTFIDYYCSTKEQATERESNHICTGKTFHSQSEVPLEPMPSVPWNWPVTYSLVPAWLQVPSDVKNYVSSESSECQACSLLVEGQVLTWVLQQAVSTLVYSFVFFVPRWNFPFL